VPSFAILVSAVLVLSCGQTDRQTESQTYGRLIHATVVGVSLKLNSLTPSIFHYF